MAGFQVAAEDHEETVTYSPRLNTCIVFQQRISDDHSTDSLEILDILTNDRPIDTGTTVKLSDRYGTATYRLWQALFNETNLAIDFAKPGIAFPTA
jgi:hypothetical protein